MYVVCGGGSSGSDGSGVWRILGAGCQAGQPSQLLVGCGVLLTGCLDGRFCSYGTKQPLTPGMSGMSLASSPFDRLAKQDLMLRPGTCLCPYEGSVWACVCVCVCACVCVCVCVCMCVCTAHPSMQLWWM